MKTRLIAVVGSKRAGKTTTIERMIRELTRRGYRVAAVKHVSEPSFTIDTSRKDTWRFAQAGAETVISVAAGEVATIEKAPLKNLSLETLLRKCRGKDVVLVEGLKELVAKEKSVMKIVVVKSLKEALNALVRFEPILAFSGPYSTESAVSEFPYADALKNPEKLADIIEDKLLKK
jgi:molybdopterin-guanine dinucleotide biosynthesis protein B